MARSHVCLNCGSETAGVRAAMDRALGLLIVRCPGCSAALVRRPDPLTRAARRSVRLVRSLALLVVRGFAVALALGWCTAVVVLMPEELFLDRFGEWREGAGIASVFGGGLDERMALIAISAAGFVAGAVVRVVWGHRRSWFAVLMFVAVFALILSMEAIAGIQQAFWGWAQGGAWAYFGPGRAEWLARGVTAALGAPGFILGWLIGGLVRSAIDWDERRRWRRRYKRRRKWAHA